MPSSGLSDLAWALLGMLQRHHQGGPKPPSGEPFEGALRELEQLGLIDSGRVTQQGEQTLRRRFDA